MPWYYFALAAAVIISLLSLLEKRALQRVSSLELSSGLALCNMLLALPLLVVATSWANIAPSTLVVIFFGTFLGALAYVLTMKSLRHLAISEFDPLFSLGPAVTAFVAFLFLGESLTRLQTLGMVLTVAGVYVLESHAHERALDPLRTIVRSKYVRYVLLVLLIHTVTSMVDRVSVTRYGYDPFLYIVIIHVFLAAQFVVLTALFGKTPSVIIRGLRGVGWLMLPISLLTVTSRMLYIISVQGATLALALAVKRTSTLFTTVVGGELFHEKNLRRKVIAASVIILGAMAIILG